METLKRNGVTYTVPDRDAFREALKDLYKGYDGKLWPQWKGSAFVGGLRSEVLVRIAFDGPNGAREAERWDMGHRIRDVEEGPDGALWVIEDEDGGRLLKLTPKK